MKDSRSPRGLKTHASLEFDGMTFNVQLHKEKGAVTLPTEVKMNEGVPEGTLSTAPDRPVEFGRLGKWGVKRGIRIHLDRADATDLLVAKSFLEECLSLYETQPK